MKKFLILAVLIFTTGCEFRKAISASYAKDFCSCYFVTKQNKQYCKTMAKQMIPISSFVIKEDNSITAKALGLKSVAIYRNKRLGCRLIY